MLLVFGDKKVFKEWVLPVFLQEKDVFWAFTSALALLYYACAAMPGQLA